MVEHGAAGPADAPDPAQATTRQAFLRALARRRVLSGDTYTQLERRSGVPKSILSDMFTRHRVPRREVVDRVIGIYARSDDEAARWVSRWARLTLDEALPSQAQPAQALLTETSPTEAPGVGASPADALPAKVPPVASMPADTSPTEVPLAAAPLTDQPPSSTGAELPRGRRLRRWAGGRRTRSSSGRRTHSSSHRSVTDAPPHARGTDVQHRPHYGSTNPVYDTHVLHRTSDHHYPHLGQIPGPGAGLQRRNGLPPAQDRDLRAPAGARPARRPLGREPGG